MFLSLHQIYGRPTIVINYPKGIKAFYMKLNDDNETVAAMDILVPKIGELIGGSQRWAAVAPELSSWSLPEIILIIRRQLSRWEHAACPWLVSMFMAVPALLLGEHLLLLGEHLLSPANAFKMTAALFALYSRTSHPVAIVDYASKCCDYIRTSMERLVLLINIWFVCTTHS